MPNKGEGRGVSGDDGPGAGAEDWELPDFVIAPCKDCCAPGDVPCAEDCEMKDFRDAEFADVDGEWPTAEERYR